MIEIVDLVGLASSRTVFLELVDAIEAGATKSPAAAAAEAGGLPHGG